MNDLEKRIIKLEKHERITGVILGITFAVAVVVPLLRQFF